MSEFELKQRLIRSVSAQGIFHVVADEWEVVPGRSQHGVGDLVLADGRGTFVVVELKALNGRTGPTARANRRRGRRTVEKQAVKYAKHWKRKHPGARKVIAATCTNETGLVVLGQV